jgi:hypothetical protein
VDCEALEDSEVRDVGGNDRNAVRSGYSGDLTVRYGSLLASLLESDAFFRQPEQRIAARALSLPRSLRKD